MLKISAISNSNYRRELQNYSSDRFSGDFAEIWYLMQIHILLRVGGLHQMPKIGEIAQKRSTGVLQFPHRSNIRESTLHLQLKLKLK
jgi:hypothetical protein